MAEEKKIYTAPETEVIRFDTEDVIVTSNPTPGPTLDPDENEVQPAWAKLW